MSLEISDVEAVDFDQIGLDDTMSLLQTGDEGLSEEEAERRLAEFGANAIEEDGESGLKRLASNLWGPIPWMIEIAAALSGALQRWEDLGVILALLTINAGVAFWEESRAADAIEALKKQLAPEAKVRRNGEWRAIQSRRLVPGDVVSVERGNIVPADAKLLDGDEIGVDESVLTGESLPVTKSPGDEIFSGTAVENGEARTVVVATGSRTEFARTAQLVEEAEHRSHFRVMVLRVARFLMVLAALLVTAVVLVSWLGRGEPLSEVILFALVLAVASIPVALPAVLTVTMAVGAHRLTRMKAIVSELDSIEEMASLDVLCSDKTGTLTLNQLSLEEPRLIDAEDPHDALLAAALTCEPETDDPMDLAILNALDDPAELERYVVEELRPFDSSRKYADADIERGDESFTVAKGAPQVILELVGAQGDLGDRVRQAVEEQAGAGYRSLGVARRDDGKWHYLALLPLLDPPRADAKETIAAQRAHGLAIKMVTGDHIGIAKQIASRLGMGQNILQATQVFTHPRDDDEVEPKVEPERIEEADGFAEVTPADKFTIIKQLQQLGHRVAMTGDGVNDAPALKQADVGIAVAGATDAARAAADLVLAAPGLGAITAAIEEARRIFARMVSYTTFRVAESSRVLVFIAATILLFASFPVTPIQIVLLVIMNDLPIMTIAYDNVRTARRPVRFNIGKILSEAAVLGLSGVAATFLLFWLARNVWGLSTEQVQTVIFLKLLVAGHLTIYLTRNDGPFWIRPFPSWKLFAAAEATQILGTLIAVYGWLVEPVGWAWAGVVWAFAVGSFLVNAGAKWATYQVLERFTPVDPYRFTNRVESG